MLINKRFILSTLTGLFLFVVFNSIPVLAQSIDIQASRLSGTNRYETSVAISKSGWVQSSTVIIATGSDYADALSASTLAKSKDAPILLTEKVALSQNTLTEIKRLKAVEAILVGGIGVIGDGVENQLRNLEINIIRIDGIDRYDTSKKIAEIIGVSKGIIVATGEDFPDALSIATISSIKSMPILLSPSNSANANISEFAIENNIPVTYLVGGASVLDPSLDTSVPNSKRLGGHNRYSTNLIINTNFQENLNFDTIYLATGNNFPDALSGSALATKNKAPIFLTSKDSISLEILDFIKIKKVKHVVILGGIGVVSKDVENLVIKSLLLLQQELKSKGGVIGTSGKGVVSLRFDDYQNVFGKDIYPLLLARGLPCSMSLISRFSTTQPWGIGTTWDQLRNWNRNGVEIWSHGTDHKDYSSKGYSGLYSQIVTSKAEIEAQNIKVVGWALPGVIPSKQGKNSLYNGLTKPSDYNSITGKLLMQTYALTEAYAYPSLRTLPTNIYHGLSHYTISEGLGLLSASKEVIDKAIENKFGIELMCHVGNLGKPGNMTLDEFTILLDYIKTQWDEGSIEVLTPSGLFFADPNSSNRLKLNTDDSFEALTIKTSGAWKDSNNWTENSIETSGGRTGDNFLRLNSTTANSAVSQNIIDLDKLGVSGEQFVFEGWIRPSGEGTKTGMVQICNSDNSKELKIINSIVSTGSSWTKVSFVFCIPPNTKNIKLSLLGSLEEIIDWDDISIKKI